MGKGIDAALTAYNALWKCATPLLKLNHRLRDGWDQRTLTGGLPARADLWVQSASGGEAYLTWEILKDMTPPGDAPLRILATATTRQGYETLCRAAEDINGRRHGLAVQPWFFPLDAPAVMRRVAAHVRPRCVLILETELWPGFLDACRRQGTRVLLANGRMTARSLGGYLAWPELFRTLAPDRIMAVSEADGRRFATLFGRERVEVMPNIKFDRMTAPTPWGQHDNPLARIIPGGSPFVVLGSVRKQEQAEVAGLASGLLHARPSAIIGLFPRHLHHIPLWRKALERAGVACAERSSLNGPAAPGTVVLWDTFGELLPAYGLARTAFVGGSLVPLGGQNFLEPITRGVVPVTGPHWSNFAWVGREIFDSGLAVCAADGAEALNALLRLLDDPPSRDHVSARGTAYIKDRRGGARAVRKQVADFLNSD
ncbi:3-deoxy-D-manno-octulosonic acid transferase [Pseudodesulfovibrio sp. F-1]|uniref:3-deoxy-D-manno-octulosonic acid transferase n=1 Tax=Pseudodesulfovibrio alkaliphilus TaxID=2661613 RepID=A0A7K1KJE8_9BACT|nr:glycosyltransferase N-terminal domain-containing protein [Pseudodesulfovibrio alkaliphilus]MUM76208.1 3-deoxy-D-manno-octulosonic acid transferase [Pseudodesulfovibrio alkaliphilus]